MPSEQENAGTSQPPSDTDLRQQLIDRVVELESIAASLEPRDAARDVLSEAKALRSLIEEMGEPVPAHPFTSMERKRATELAERGAAAVVFASTCETIRRRRHGGETSPEIADELGISNDAVVHHAQGDCEHDHSVQPTGRSGSRITAKTCGKIRKRRSNGDRISAIIDGYDDALTKWTVSVHASGDCPHDIDEPPVTTNEVPADECENWRRAVRGDETAYGIATNSRFCRMTIQNHVSGNCDHDLSIRPLQYDGDGWVVQEGAA